LAVKRKEVHGEKLTDAKATLTADILEGGAVE
jgi:hypothetical protein